MLNSRDALLWELMRLAPEDQQLAMSDLNSMFQMLRQYQIRAGHSQALYQNSRATRIPLSTEFSKSRPPARLEDNFWDVNYRKQLTEYEAREAELRTNLDQLSGWMHIAARDTVLNVFHYSDVFKAIDGFWPRHIPFLEGNIDFNMKKAAEGIFEEAYPYATPLRNAVAHEGSFSTPTKVGKHQVSNFSDFGIRISNGAQARISDMLSNDTYISTFEGKAVHLDMMLDHSSTLMKATDMLIDSFTISIPEDVRRWIQSASSMSK